MIKRDRSEGIEGGGADCGGGGGDGGGGGFQMNFSPMNVPLICEEEENASRQRALQFRRRRRMSRPRSNQGPSQSDGISPPVKRILLPGGVMLLHNHALIRHFNFFPRPKQVSSCSILRRAALSSTAFFAMKCNQEGEVAVGAKTFFDATKLARP